MWTSLKAAAVVVLCAFGCATAPETPSGRRELEASADDTLRAMIRRDPSLNQVLSNAAGYVVFPSIGKGGVIVGGAYGQGVLYERGRRTGFVKVEQASLGAQLGGQTFSEVLILQNHEALRDVKDGDYTLSGDASVVALTAGAASTIEFNQGVAAVVMPRGGAMVDVSIAGQRLQYVPAG